MNKNILITGSGGFIGSALSAYLENSGYTVFQFDMVEHGDICCADLSALYPRVGHVVHLAAKTFVPESWENPAEYYRVNVMGTINVLDFCRKSNSTLTYLNTYVYGPPKYLPVDETHPINPNTPYNHSKMLAEGTCQFFSEHMNVSVTVLRLFNIYGIGQNKTFLIPSIIEQALDPKIQNITVNDLEPKRDYIYIDDLLNIVPNTFETTRSGFRTYNIGSGKSHSVKEIIDCVQTLARTGKPITCKDLPRKNEISDIYADISKAGSELGFKPSVSLESGLKKVISQTGGESF